MDIIYIKDSETTGQNTLVPRESSKVISRKLSTENENLIKKVPFGLRGICIKKQELLSLKEREKEARKIIASS